MTASQSRKDGAPERPSGPPSDPHYTLPLYRKAEAARIIRVPANTLHNWADDSASHHKQVGPYGIRA